MFDISSKKQTDTFSGLRVFLLIFKKKDSQILKGESLEYTPEV